MPVYGAAFKQVRTVTGKFPQKTPQRDVCGAPVSEDTHKDTEFTAVRVPDNVRAAVRHFPRNTVFQNADHGHIGKTGRTVNLTGLGKSNMRPVSPVLLLGEKIAAQAFGFQFIQHKINIFIQVTENMRNVELMQAGEFTVNQITPNKLGYGAGAVELMVSLNAEVFTGVMTR